MEAGPGAHALILVAGGKAGDAAVGRGVGSRQAADKDRWRPATKAGLGTEWGAHRPPLPQAPLWRSASCTPGLAHPVWSGADRQGPG